MNTNLMILILCEFVFIIASYYSEIGSLAILPAGVYTVLAVVDVGSKNKNLSWLVLLMTAGIAIPRLLIQYNNLEIKNRKLMTERVNESIVTPPKFKPIIQDCDAVRSWEVRACFRENRRQQALAHKQEEKISASRQARSDLVTEATTEIKIPLHDWGLFFLYFCLSVSMPAAVLILLHDTEPEPEPDQETERAPSRSTIYRQRKKAGLI